MVKAPGGIYITGPAANGKTTYFELLQSLLMKKHARKGDIGVIDMSDILTKFGVLLTCTLGEQVRKALALAKKGNLVPSGIIIPLYEKWIAEKLPHVYISTLIAAGIPRDPAQVPVMQVLRNPILIHIKIDRQVAYNKMWKRAQEMAMKLPPGQQRIDHTLDKGAFDKMFNQRMNEHRYSTLPAIQLAAKTHPMLELDRKVPLTERLGRTLEFLKDLKDKSPVPQDRVMAGLNRINCDTHPIHDEIRAIEHPPKVQPVATSIVVSVQPYPEARVYRTVSHPVPPQQTPQFNLPQIFASGSFSRPN